MHLLPDMGVISSVPYEAIGGLTSGMDLLLDVEVVIVVVFVEVDLHMSCVCLDFVHGQRGGGVRSDLARGQHGDEESLDHDRLLLRVGVLA